MATRFYLPSSGAAAVTPALGAWDETAAAGAAIECVTTRTSSAMTSVVVAKGTAIGRALARQYVSKPIAAQTISAGTVKGQVLALESAINDNLDLVPMRITVVSQDGTTLRGTILALGDYATALEFGTVLTNRKIADGDATTSVTALAGDRIVIEIGIKNSTIGTSVSGSLSFGDNSATDLAEDTTTTAANNPWVELSQTIVFLVGKPRRTSMQRQKRRIRQGKARKLSAVLLVSPASSSSAPRSPIRTRTKKKARRHGGKTTQLRPQAGVAAAPAGKPTRSRTITSPKKRKPRKGRVQKLAAVLLVAPAGPSTAPRPSSITVVRKKKRRSRQGTTILAVANVQQLPSGEPTRPVMIVTRRKPRKRKGSTTQLRTDGGAAPPSVSPRKSSTRITAKKKRKRIGSVQLLAARAALPVAAVTPRKPTLVTQRKRRKHGGELTLVSGARRAPVVAAVRPKKPATIVPRRKPRVRKGSRSLLIAAPQQSTAGEPPRPVSLTLRRRPRIRKGSSTLLSAGIQQQPAGGAPRTTLALRKKSRRHKGDTTQLRATGVVPQPVRPSKPKTIVTTRKRRKHGGVVQLLVARAASPAVTIKPGKPITMVKPPKKRKPSRPKTQLRRARPTTKRKHKHTIVKPPKQPGRIRQRSNRVPRPAGLSRNVQGSPRFRIVGASGGPAYGVIDTSSSQYEVHDTSTSQFKVTEE